jgi:hypothetical protein
MAVIYYGEPKAHNVAGSGRGDSSYLVLGALTQPICDGTGAKIAHSDACQHPREIFVFCFIANQKLRSSTVILHFPPIQLLDTFK